MGTGYSVDLSYLQDTVKKLQGVADGMDECNLKATYHTDLGRDQFGGEKFLEAQGLSDAHKHMKDSITAMIGTLQSMIQEFQSKTSAAHAAYSGHEDATVTGFNGSV